MIAMYAKTGPSERLIVPLAGGFGAQVEGVDLRCTVEEPDAEWLRLALGRHRLLVIPGQNLTNAEQVAVTRTLGEVAVYPVGGYTARDQPEVMRISNILLHGRPVGLYDGDTQEEWHTDGSWSPQINAATLLYSVVSPEEGGATVFADATGAYEHLPDDRKKLLDGLTAVHSMRHLLRQELATNPHKSQLSEEEGDLAPDSRHPVVHVHPVTGRKSLLLGSMIISRIDGLSADASQRLLTELLEHATQEKYLYRHQWRDGDLVIWDNHATLHTRTACDSSRHHRLLYRTTVR